MAACFAKSSRVLLISVNSEAEPYPVYPLALDYLRAPLESAGCQTRVWDCQFALSQGLNLEDMLHDYKPDVALVSIRNADNNDSVNIKDYLPQAFALVETLHAGSNAKIVLGGSGYSLFPEEILKRSQADCGVAGSGEYVILSLLERLLTGKDVADIAGVVYRNGTSCAVTPPGPAPAINASPARDLELMKFYWQQGGIPGVQLKRGCPFKCIYCTYPLLEGGAFQRKAAVAAVAAVNEIQQIYETCGVDQFFMVDSVLNAIPSLLGQFAAELCRRKLPVRWTGYFMPKHLTLDDLLLYKASGLDGIEFGVDTLAEPLLEAWGKGFDVADFEQSIQACQDAAVPHSMYLIFGGPGETSATLETTIARAQACSHAVVFGFFGMRIYPRTRLHDIALQSGVLDSNDDLLQPRFFISPQLDLAATTQRLNELGRLLHWLVAGPSLQKKHRAAARLRSRGRKGALWQELLPP